jgi:hypothetical protein
MQLIDNTIYIAQPRKSQPRLVAPSLATRLKNATASQRLSILVIGGWLGVVSPALVSTVVKVASLSLTVLVEFSRIGLVAFQLFGR